MTTLVMNAQTFDFSCGPKANAFPTQSITTTNFRTDAFYGVIDWDNPESYLEAFILDAERRAGLDYAYLRDVELNITLGHILQSGVCATAQFCSPTAIEVFIDRRCWNSSLYSGVLNQRLRLMYHEFGHAVQNYEHPDKSMGYNGHLDIMGYDNITVRDWDEAANRFFRGTDHTIRDCSGGKGTTTVNN